MTDEQIAHLSKRTFEMLVFIVRRGIVHRLDRQTIVLSVLDNVPAELACRSMSQAAQGRFVLMTEEGCIKPDFSRMWKSAFHALDTMTDADYLKFIKNVEPWRGQRQEDFRSHLRRSFPSFLS